MTTTPIDQKDATARLLAHLHRGGRWAYLWTKQGEEKLTHWYKAGEPRPRIGMAGRDVYFGVHSTDRKKGHRQRAEKQDITAINCLFAEFDAKDFEGDKSATLAHIEGLPRAPSVVIDSGGGYHGYWLLRETFSLGSEGDRKRADQAQKAWVTLCRGDDGAKDLARVLRYPGTRNQKYPDKPVVTIVKADFALLYDLGELETLARPATTKAAAAPTPAKPSDNGHNRYAAAALAGELGKVRAAQEGDRNKTLNSAAFAMGQLVGAGALTRGDVESELTAAALAVGLGERETTATIRSGLDDGTAEPRALPEPEPKRGKAAKPKAPQPGAQPAEPVKDPSSPWPYAVQDGRIVYQTQRVDQQTGEVIVSSAPVADWSARITEEITTEDGERSYKIAGQATRGKRFEVELLAEDFADDRKLKAVMDAQAGARDPIRAGMTKHVGPAIKLLTGDDLVRATRYTRTGWAGGQFLLPGREPDGVTIALPRKLPYSIGDGADLKQGLVCLSKLAEAMGAERGTLALAFAFQAPLSLLAGWRNERYCLFISGRTGALKTSFAQTVMALYGPGFLRDELLIKWGEGATRNAIMALATHAHDLPLMLDNFKPSTGGGATDFVNLIHNILEGGEKDRLNRGADLKDTKPVFCWPLVTGEDVPDKDPATLARILVLPFAWQRGESNEILTEAQNLAAHLPAVGTAWLTWLESNTGAAVASEARKQYSDLRSKWAKYLRGKRPDMVNVLRVASNLASNQLTWWAMGQHPSLGPVVKRYTEQHQAGLQTVANTMGNYTAQALEATRFVETIRQLIAAGRAILLSNTSEEKPSNPSEIDRFVGWGDGTEGAYLIPDIARAQVEKLLGQDALGYLSNAALYSQLDALGFLASKDNGRMTKTIRVGDKAQRVLHLGRHAMQEAEA